MYRIIYDTQTGAVRQSKHMSDKVWGRFQQLNSDVAYIPGYLSTADLNNFTVDINTQELVAIDHPAESDEAYIRQRRSILLAQTDWTQAVDAPLSAEQKTAWQTYRQTLRDIPQDYDLATVSRDAIQWPARP